MYPLFESIRILDGKALHLGWHQERMENAFRVFYGKNCTYSLEQIFETQSCAGSGKGTVKARFLYNDKGYDLEFVAYAPRDVRTLKIVEANEVDYALKYTDRSQFEKLLALKDQCDDILIVRKGMVTDTSYSNIVFFHRENWITPSLPLLKGTARNRLLAEGKISEASIAVDQLTNYESFKLINAMLDFSEQQKLPLENIKFQ